jgi:hypothetical protein
MTSRASTLLVALLAACAARAQSAPLPAGVQPLPVDDIVSPYAYATAAEHFAALRAQAEARSTTSRPWAQNWETHFEQGWADERRSS